MWGCTLEIKAEDATCLLREGYWVHPECLKTTGEETGQFNVYGDTADRKQNNARVVSKTRTTMKVPCRPGGGRGAGPWDLQQLRPQSSGRSLRVSLRGRNLCHSTQTASKSLGCFLRK